MSNNREIGYGVALTYHQMQEMLWLIEEERKRHPNTSSGSTRTGLYISKLTDIEKSIWKLFKIAIKDRKDLGYSND